MTIKYLKWIAFVLLIFQASGHALVARKSRLFPGKAYLSSTAVLISEMIKLIISMLMSLYSQEKVNFTKLYDDILGKDSDYLKMTIPAILYFLQNMMNFIAISHLDPATFQITQQFKILTTAMFSVLILKTRISLRKWGYLLLILVGIILVQMQDSTVLKSNTGYGLAAVITACFTSGFAGIYFEKALKTRKNVSLFTRNIQVFWLG
jgi:solute carrier family 35 (UDP-sugar transporter), member A1/2/3